MHDKLSRARVYLLQNTYRIQRGTRLSDNAGREVLVLNSLESRRFYIKGFSLGGFFLQEYNFE